MESFKLMQDPKILISCSSKDKEFLTLLKHIQTTNKKAVDPLKDIIFKNGYNKPLLLYRGGTPANFDNSPESVPANDIQVVRGLKAMAIIQAYKMLLDIENNHLIPAENYKLDPELQRITAETFLNLQPADRYSKDTMKKLNDRDYIEKLSGGKYYPLTIPTSSDTHRLSPF